jgi:hypothetical protein
LCGREKIDLALVDISSVSTACRIGYLGTHERTDSDHVVGYIDLDQQMFSQGLLNRPTQMQGQPIRIKQPDKIRTHLETLISKVEHQKIHQWTIDLAP